MENGNIAVPGAGFSPRTEILLSQYPVFAVQSKQPGAGETGVSDQDKGVPGFVQLCWLKDSGEIFNDTISVPKIELG